mgnify:CR=1 FL=1
MEGCLYGLQGNLFVAEMMVRKIEDDGTAIPIFFRHPRSGQTYLFTSKFYDQQYQNIFSQHNYIMKTYCGSRPPKNFALFLRDLRAHLEAAAITNPFHLALLEFTKTANSWIHDPNRRKRRINLNKLKSQFGVKPGERLTDTEIHFLFHLWENQHSYSFIDPFIHRVTITFSSKMDVCNVCTFALYQFLIARILNVYPDNVTIQATCWCSGCISSLWGRQINNNWQNETKKLVY